jgi:NAD+ kinase
LLAPEIKIFDLDTIATTCDIMLSIGGDGTILSTVRKLNGHSIPILGIHIGGLGFLAECTIDNLRDSLQYIVDGKYEISEHMLLDANVSDLKGNTQSYTAMNDFVVDHGNSARILKTEVSVSDKYVNTYESDGVIFATPIGSTAYSLSAGGPIIHPSLNTVTITPISPHSLSARPIVLDGDTSIKLRFPEEHVGIAFTTDGQVYVPINHTDSISIQKSHKIAKLVKLPFNTYFNTLHTKMGWSGKVR